MSLTAIAIEKRTVSYFVVILLVLAGIGAFLSLGQLEDPEFTVKTAVITTLYPGASPEEVELELTDRLELAIQEMPQVDYIESFSRAGMSLISVEIKHKYVAEELPQIWINTWPRSCRKYGMNCGARFETSKPCFLRGLADRMSAMILGMCSDSSWPWWATDFHMLIWKNTPRISEKRSAW
jgi:hypothetical protein